LTKCGWMCRFYTLDEQGQKVTLDWVGNYPEYKDRQEDDVVVFSGMYGIDSYMIWYIHKNLGFYDFSTVHIELELHSEGNLKKPFWHKDYKVLEVKYNSKEDKYVLFGISLDSAKLQTKLVDYGKTGLKYKENRTPKDVLIDMLEPNIFIVEYMENDNEIDLRNFEYRALTFDENWRVVDFINYIADQNEFEYYVRGGILYIGKECKAITNMNTTRKFDLETDNISDSAWFKKYQGNTRPMDVMAHINKYWRCVWAKHIAGKSGGISKGCFTRIGLGTLDKELYAKTLEGQPEIMMASTLFQNKPYSHYLMIGNIIKDSGDPTYIDQISVQKNKELCKVNTPEEIKIDRGDEPLSPIFQEKERVSRMTPFADYNAGLLFPIQKLIYGQEPPNAVIGNIKGKEESSVCLGYVLGNGREGFKYPLKNKEDLRLQLENGWCLYVRGTTGETYLQPSGTDPQDYPPGIKSDEVFVHLQPVQREIKLNECAENYLYLKDGKAYFIGNEFLEIGTIAGDIEINSVDGSKYIQIKVGNNIIKIDGSSNEITIDSDDKVTVTTGGDAKIDATGKVDVISTSEIKATVGSNTVTLDTGDCNIEIGSTTLRIGTAGVIIT